MNIFKQIKEYFYPTTNLRSFWEYEDYPERNRSKYDLNGLGVYESDYKMNTLNDLFCYEKGREHRKRFNNRNDLKAAKKLIKKYEARYHDGGSWEGETVSELKNYIHGWYDENLKQKTKHLTYEDASEYEEEVFRLDGYNDRVKFEATGDEGMRSFMELQLKLSKETKDVWQMQITDAYLEGWNKADEDISGKESYSI